MKTTLEERQRARELAESLRQSLAREKRLREAATNLLDELHCYYFQAGDSELEAVNCVRRLVGMREQLPKYQEAELQWQEAEKRDEPTYPQYPPTVSDIYETFGN